MTLPVEVNPLLLAADDSYNIQRSLRFRSSASAFLNRTPASAGNLNKWTFSTWIKRGRIGVAQDIISKSLNGTSNSNLMAFYFDANDKLILFQYTGTTVYTNLTTTQVFRDPSSWYHIVLVYDDAQATASNRVKIYVNGIEITSFSTATYPSQNFGGFWNQAEPHAIGRDNGNPNGNYLDGYLAEVNFIDGQALTPSSFGETNAATGVWQPKRYTGTYGTNGFYLPFSDPTNTTTLTQDRSGNGNNWTANNISLSDGVTYDSMTDVPTLTSATQANYCVLNPLDVSNSSLTLSNGNLTATQPTTGTGRSAFGSILVTSGKWYFEGVITTTNNTFSGIGIADSALGSVFFVLYRKNGQTAGLTGSPTFNTYTNGDVIGVALDLDASTITFYKNNVAQGTGSYSFSRGSVPVSALVNINSADTTGAWNVNFGQRPFAYTPPTGFVALNTFNLPTPTIGATASTQANRYFDISLYTGNGGTQTISGLNFQPDFVWGKARSSAIAHNLFDAVRGGTRQLETNGTGAEVVRAGNAVVFNSNGITLDAAFCNINNTSVTNVAWQWNAGGSTVTNNSGSISSQVRANPSAGFSIVTYTGNAVNGATVGHGLGIAPRMIILKDRTTGGASYPWFVYHASLGNTVELRLNSTNAATTNTVWNNTTPSSTVFTLGAPSGGSNASGDSYVAYCFAETAGYSRFGSYTGNGSADGPFVFCGFRPRYVMTKRSDSTSDWYVLDSSRNTFNVMNNRLVPNLSDAEASGSNLLDFTSNGFKIRDAGTGINASAGTYIFMAFAENPFKYSLAR